MIDKTILVIDVDQETEEKIVSTLEAEDYLVFAASGKEITSGMAGKISPALIFLKPTANSVEGFEVCKAIHSNEAFKNVPIIVLASLKVPLDARYTSFYGIVDFLEMPASPGAVIEKTEKVLGSKSHDSVEPVVEDVMQIKEESLPEKKKPRAQYKDPLEEFARRERSQPGEDYSYRGGEKSATGSPYNKGQRVQPKKSGLIVPLLVVVATIALVAGGFLTYKLFFSPAGMRIPLKVMPSKAVQQKAPPVLPSGSQQPEEQPVAEVKPAETKGAPQQAPQQAAKQASQKAPAVVPAAKPVVEPFYSVQLGAFKSELSAEALVKVYKGKGHEAFTYEGTTKDNRPVYRVLIGKFKNRKEASQLADKLQAKEKIKTTVFSEGVK